MKNEVAGRTSMMGDHDFDLERLNPGIRLTVRWLRSLGFKTIDSGDGHTHDFECDRSYPYVVIRVRPSELAKVANQVRGLILMLGLEEGDIGPDGLPTGPHVEATYIPAYKRAYIDLVGLDDEMLLGADSNLKEVAHVPG